MVNKFVRDNAYQLLVVVFMAGVMYSNIHDMGKEIEALEIKQKADNQILQDRLSKKIKIINILDKRVDALEKCN